MAPPAHPFKNNTSLGFAMSFSSFSPAQHKALLRLDMKAARSQFNEIERARAALSLCHTLCPWLEAQKDARIGVYLARPFEISLDPLISALLETGVEVSAPRLDLAAQEMAFWHLPSLEEVRRGPWSVREPTSGELCKPTIVLAPVLALDAQGHRLGTGGGWYDRVLSSEVLSIGIAFDFQILKEVPTEAHDQNMHFVWSDKRHFDCSRSM